MDRRVDAVICDDLLPFALQTTGRRLRLMAKKKTSVSDKLREHALGFPEAVEEFPWGTPVVKVKGKIFVFLGHETDTTLGVKLPQSGDQARDLPFVKPAGYGLGKSGWVQVTLDGDEQPPLGLLLSWITESYRAVAPKKLSKLLDQ